MGKKSPIAPGAGPPRLRPKLSHSGRCCGKGGSEVGTGLRLKLYSCHCYFVVCFVFETGFHVAQAGLQLETVLRQPPEGSDDHLRHKT